MGRWGVTGLPPRMGKLRQGDAGRGPLSKKSLGTQRAAEFTSAKALAILALAKSVSVQAARGTGFLLCFWRVFPWLCELHPAAALALPLLC